MEANICDICKYTTTNCICNDEWVNLYKNLGTKIENMLNPSELKVSTISLCFNLSNCIFDLGEIDKQFQPGKIFKEIKFKKDAKKSKKKELNNYMYNQCKLTGIINKTNKKGKIVVKIYKNGEFVVVGLQDVSTIPFYVRYIDHMLKKKYKNVIKLVDKEKPCIMENVRITLINAVFYINKQIKQSALNKILNDDEYSLKNGGPISHSCYDPGKYAGINTKHVIRKKNEDKTLKELISIKTRKGREKFIGEVTILTFRSGAIMLTGGSNLEEIYSAYEYINNILMFYDDIVLT